MSDEQPATGPADLTLTLTKPVQSHGKEVAELTFREPSGADILACGGNPVAFDPVTAAVDPGAHPQRMRLMLSRLAAVPPSTIDQMTAPDWTSASWLVAPFFMPTPGAV